MRKISSIFIIILTFLQAQNLDQYSQAIEQGQLSTVREDIKQLKDEYPDIFEQLKKIHNNRHKNSWVIDILVALIIVYMVNFYNVI